MHEGLWEVVGGWFLKIFLAGTASFLATVKYFQGQVDLINTDISTYRAKIAVLESQHEDKIARLERIEDSVGAVSAKQDEAMRLLLTMKK